VRRPDDNELTEQGWSATGAGRVLLIACGALAHEILALKRVNGWNHLDLVCLPAILHNRPERIPAAVAEAVTRHRAAYERAFVVYADCGTGGALQRVCADLGVEMLPGPHCYSFFEGNAVFAERGEVTCFYLTDFLARQFDAFVWRSLGLDRNPDLRDDYFGNYETLVYLAQTDDPRLTEIARGCADRLGLAFERRFTGLAPFAALLADGVKDNPPG
jgi:hypothetical protein